jgi:signal transduction histidine kinase
VRATTQATERPARWPWAIWAVVVAGLVPTMLLSLRAGSFSEDPYFIPIAVMLILGYATVGAIVLSRSRNNPIGWLLLAVGTTFVIVGLSDEYLQFVEATGRVSDRMVPFVALVTSILWAPMLAIVALIVLLFPTGRVPGRRWRPLPWIIGGGIAIFLLGSILAPGALDADETGVPRPIENPFGVDALAGVAPAARDVASIVILLCIAPAIVGLIVRYRRSRGEERQQIRWLAYVIGAVAALAVVQIALTVFADLSDETFAMAALFLVSFALLGLGVPIATGVAVLRYRLYDLDLVVKKTVVFGVLVVLVMGASLLAAFVASTLLTVVVPDRTNAVGVGMFLVGLSVWPLWRLARRIADRLVYGGRATPYEVLTEFGERVGETYSSEDVLPRMAQLLAQATGATVATVWLRVGGELRPAATWPPDAGTVPPARFDDASDDVAEVLGEDAVAVRHQGELLGALSVRMPASDPIGAGRQRIVRDLAAQAGLVLRNVRLIEELRESRRRIVAAQDDRAKRLERNIHDGAQQQLVALAVKARIAGGMVSTDRGKAEALLGEIQRELTEALEDLRDLARGIYPPLLADRGLAAALAAQARKSPVPVVVDADGAGRFPREIEATVYFSVLEALQNVSKYADATTASVRLAVGDGRLRFEVVDDGHGFDPATTGYGSGLQGIADRFAALGGSVEVASAPGRGTKVVGEVPVGTA